MLLVQCLRWGGLYKLRCGGNSDAPLKQRLLAEQPDDEFTQESPYIMEQ